MAHDAFKFQITVITKTWVNPEDHNEGINVSTWHDYATTKSEAEAIGSRVVRGTPPGAISVLAFYTKITMIEQMLEVEAS